MLFRYLLNAHRNLYRPSFFTKTLFIIQQTLLASRALGLAKLGTQPSTIGQLIRSFTLQSVYVQRTTSVGFLPHIFSEKTTWTNANRWFGFLRRSLPSPRCVEHDCQFSLRGELVADIGFAADAG